MKYDHINDYNRVAAAIYWLFLEKDANRFGGVSLAKALAKKQISNKEQYCLHRMCDDGFLSREIERDDFDGEEYVVYVIEPSIVDYVNKHVDDDIVHLVFQSHQSGNTEEVTSSDDIEVAWEPLQINDATAKTEAIESIESALSAIEADNGYAANHPEQRDTITASIRAGLDLLRNFRPTREQIRALIIKPLMQVATVFGTHAVAELAKKAVGKLLALF